MFEIKNNTLQIFEKEIDFGLSFEQALDIFADYIVEDYVKDQSIILKDVNLFNVTYKPELIFSEKLKEVILYPTFDFTSEEQGLAELESLSKAKLKECDLSFKDVVGETPLRNESHITYLLNSFIVDLSYNTREYLLAVSILNNSVKNIFSTILDHYMYFARKISEETGDSIETAKKIIPNVKNINENLNEELFAWLKNKEINTNYKGITINDIKEKYKHSYFRALFDMSVIMSDDDYIELFKQPLKIK